VAPQPVNTVASSVPRCSTSRGPKNSQGCVALFRCGSGPTRLAGPEASLWKEAEHGTLKSAASLRAMAQRAVSDVSHRGRDTSTAPWRQLFCNQLQRRGAVQDHCGGNHGSSSPSCLSEVTYRATAKGQRLFSPSISCEANPKEPHSIRWWHEFANLGFWSCRSEHFLQRSGKFRN
jgi:hypothetical protein